MSTTFILLRHAERESSFSGDDFLCPISAKGKQEAAATAQKIKESGFIPSLIITSPATRTKETGEIINLLFQVPIEEADAFSLSGNFENFVASLLTQEKTYILVGHAPTLSFLFTYLTGKQYPHGFKTAHGVVVQFSKNKIPGNGTFGGSV